MGEEKQEIFSHIRLSLFSVFNLQTLGHPDMSCDPFHFLSLQEGDPQTLSHPFTQTPEIPPLTGSVFYLPACVWRDFVLQESKKDPLPVSNCLSHSTLSLNPPHLGYFLLFLAPSLFLRLYGGLCQLSDAQNTDSSPLNMILENATLFPPHTHKLSHAQFSRSKGWREQVLAVEIHYFWAHTHRQMDTERSHGDTHKHLHTHTHLSYPWDTTDVCGKNWSPMWSTVARKWRHNWDNRKYPLRHDTRDHTWEENTHTHTHREKGQLV